MALMQEKFDAASSVKKRKLKMPHVFVVLMSVLILAYITTLIIPSGSFEREEMLDGRSIVVPDSFQFIDAPSLTFYDFLFAIPSGMVNAGPLIFGGMMIGALFEIVSRTGIFNIIIGFIEKVFRKRKKVLIPSLMIPLAGFTAITGAFELSLIYIPALIPLFIRLGYDRFTAFALITVSTGAGFTVAITAPATVGLAQTISGIPLYSGMVFRLILLSVILVMGIWYVMRYAKKITNDPKTSYVYADGIYPEFSENESTNIDKITGRQIGGLLFIAIGIGVMCWGLFTQGWFFIEIGGWYAFMGVVLGLICGMTPSKIAETFNVGFQKVLVAVIVIGLARSISVILENGQILDTIIYFSSGLVSFVPAELTPIMMMIIQASINAVISSGSGQAIITMPVMSGLADLLNVTQQTSVLAFQFGDGYSMLVYPTGLILALLALAKISYGKWLKFILPLVISWYVISAIALVIAQSIGLQ